MQAKQLSAGEGWRWLAAGFALFRKNPPMLTLIIIAYWLTLATVNTIPLLGPLAATLAIPAFSVSLMNAVRKLDRGQPLEFPVLFSGFRKELKTLVMLGGLYLVTSLSALGASAIVDGGMFLQAMIGAYKPSPEEIASGDFLLAAQITLILMAPVIMAWWYAPVLVAWHGFTAGKALFFSLFACLRNWRAFLAYTACALIFGGLLPGIVLGALVAIVPGASSFASTLLMLPLMFILAPTLVASFYVSYREVFTDSEPAQSESDGEPPPDAPAANE
ncbi:MAG: hypothetical protein L6Q60_08940 [Rhodocyclaceae bacterium]|nr:hypothetical protein [Rhodocyclaceae bacterium]